MSPDRFAIDVQPNADDGKYLVVLEVIGFPDMAQAQAFSDQLSQWVANTDNHDGR